MPDKTLEKSYEAQSKTYHEYVEGGAHQDIGQSWLRHGTIDAWRHDRMYALFDILVNWDKSHDWLTVGDGRYGNDAHYIHGLGVNVLATDITDVLLNKAVSKGHIQACKSENAESLSFVDDSFDYVFCKESYHHFPRPMIALCEMLRVARKGIVLLEPNDILVPSTYLQSVTYGLKYLIRQLIGKPINKHVYETSGNYMYTLSRREIEKFSLGVGLTCVAYHGINDCYLPGVEQELVDDDSELFKQVKNRIKKSDLLTRLGLKANDLLAVILFVTPPDTELRHSLTSAGYMVVDLPENPYL